jgi:NAD(P)-dependent dehydrogenase (short-subunit alcohol dehydrogenase family)
MSRSPNDTGRVLVTGAARGIGRAIAERFARDGAPVLVSDVNLVAAREVATQLTTAGASAVALALDVADPDAQEAARERLGGGFATVVANAGIQGFARATELTAAAWDRVLRINARGTLLTLQTAAAILDDGGSVVTVASIQALLPNPLSADYAASKAAVLSLTRTFAAQLAPRGIRVNAVAPGRIDTELSDYAGREVGRLTGTSPEDALAERIATNPLGRTGTPAEVAAAVAFLASSEASYITGECLNVCGGDVMMP